MSLYLVAPLLVMSQLLDGISTILVIYSLGLSTEVEANPIARFLLNVSPTHFLLLKALGALLASLLIVYAQKRRPRAAKWVLLLTVSIGIVASVLNSYQLVWFLSA